MRLPVIVGLGGVNAAGRTSFHHGYRRMIINELSAEKKQHTLASLAQLMGLAVDGKACEQQIMSGTLVRRIEKALFDVTAVDYHQRIKTVGNAIAPTVFELEAKSLPADIPSAWSIEKLEGNTVRVTISDEQTLLLPSKREIDVQSAGQLPSGFNPGQLYTSRNHPRGLEMTVYGASDAIRSTGINWEQVSERVPGDQISVYAGCAMSQLDANGNGGMLSARYKGRKVTSKQCPLGLAQMPADFINAYLLGSIGTTGSNMGACATFLYNLRQAVSDIQSGKSRIAIVGNSEAPILPDVIEGYAAMGALATDKELRALDNGELDYRRACRPFAENCGFTLSESSQYIVLFDDVLAVELGANIYGAVTDVFVNADGYKKSISSPGIGNYITVAKALASAQSLLGEDSIKHRSYVQAHGTSTPQNRVSESDILNRVAGHFGIQSWPVVAIKNFLGHSLSVSSADQLMSTLGVWEEGILPGITNIDKPAEDVHCEHLNISNEHKNVGVNAMDSAIINAKGFGGNNASAVVISPNIVKRMLASRYTSGDLAAYHARAEVVCQQAQQYDKAMMANEVKPIYRFDYNVLHEQDLEFSEDSLLLKNYKNPINLALKSPYKNWLV